jgi:crotonobetainyl-CoA:carnitine CoA-transferase CaiB-like acyl-CoA transferase
MTINQHQFFKGLKVVEFASVLAGPAVGMFLAELGAEVVKIENKTTGGDVTRSWKQVMERSEAPVSAYWCSVNWGKTYLFLDLNDETDRKHAIDLALASDVVISNFKPSFAQRIGVDAASLHHQNPLLIYAQLSSFADPEDESPAFDAVLQAEAGYMFMNGEPNRPPVKMPVAMIDTLAAHQLKEGILLGLLHRARTGKGCVVSTSLMESALASLVNQASNYLMNGAIPQRMGSQHPNIAPYGDMFETKDGSLLLLAAGTERQFRQLCTCLNLEQLPLDPKFQENRSRVKNRTALNAALAEAIIKKEINEILAQLKNFGVPAARIRNMKEVFELPGASEMVLEEDVPGFGVTKRVKTVAFNIR